MSLPAASLFPPLLVAQGIESGRFSPSDEVSLGNDALKVSNYVVRDWYPYGADTLSVAQVVAKSSNVGLAKLAGSGRAPAVVGRGVASVSARGCALQRRYGSASVCVYCAGPGSGDKTIGCHEMNEPRFLIPGVRRPGS